MQRHLTEPTRSKRVLIVEDEDRLRGILARYLRGRGHHVMEAINAIDALQMFKLERVDVLLLDINLVGDTGWDLLRWLQCRVGQSPVDPQPRVVIVSAIPPLGKRLEQFRPDAVLLKPFPVDSLARLVESACRPPTVERDRE